MKTKGQKLVALFLTAFMAMSFMAVSLGNTAFAYTEKLPDESCPAGQVDLTSSGIAGCENANLLEPCENDPQKQTYKDGSVDLCTGTDTAGKAAESKIAQESFQKMSSLLIAFETMINKLLWPVLMLTGDLMNNNILFGPGMEQKLYDIWVPVRNIINIFFVIALIGLALYSVLGINSENGQYSIKAMLPKLIAGIIAVNFSFIAIKVVLDTVNVFTTAVFAIPTQVQGLDKAVLDNSMDGETTRLREAYCQQLYLDGKQFDSNNPDAFTQGTKEAALFMIRDRFGLGGISDAKQIDALGQKLQPPAKQEAFTNELKKLTGEFAMCEINEGNKLVLSTMGIQFFQKYGSHNAALAMAINMGEIMFYNRPSISLIGSGTYESLAIKVIFILLMYLIYGASFIAMFIVLLARLIVVWMGLAMSPVIALSVAVPMVKDKLGLGEITSKFMKHAIAPIMMAFPMMIGWVMLNAIHSTSSEGPSAYAAKDMLIPGIPIPGLETLQGLLVSLATAAVVWIGVFAAAEGTIAGKLTGFMKDQLERFGKFVATAPIKYTPWVPVQVQEGRENYSPAALLTAANKFQNDLQTESENKFIRAHPDFFPGGGAGGSTALNSRTTLDGLMKVIAQDGEKMKKDPKEYNERIHLLATSDALKDLKEVANGTKQVDGLDQTSAKQILKAIEAKDFKELPSNAKQLAEKYVKAHQEGAPAPGAPAAGQTPEDKAKAQAKTLGYEDKDLEKGDGKKTVKAIATMHEKIGTSGTGADNAEAEKTRRDALKEVIAIKDKNKKPLSIEKINEMIDGVGDLGAKTEEEKKVVEGKKTAWKKTAQTMLAPPQPETPPPTGGTTEPPAGGSPTQPPATTQ